MKATRITKTLGVLAIMLLLCLWLPAALAADATEVYVNHVKLDAGSPYWKNNDAPADENDWNAHFDAASATLTLDSARPRNAVDIPGQTNYAGLVYANGDLTVILQGNNNFYFFDDMLDDRYFGFYIDGSAAFSGTGSLNLFIVNAHTDSMAYAVYTKEALTIESGTYDMETYATDASYGLYAETGILITGGQMELYTQAPYCAAIDTYSNYFRMTGGTVNAVAESPNNASFGVYGRNVALEGGTGIFTGSFSGTGTNNTYGLGFSNSPLQYSGGSFTVIGDTSAILYARLDIYPNYSVLNGVVDVSKQTDGSSLRRWESVADGQLASNFTETSKFAYVRFMPTQQSTVSIPQTGDSAQPWLWAGIGMICLLSALGIAASVWRKCH